MAFTVVIPSKSYANLSACVNAIRMNEPDILPNRIRVIDDGIDGLVTGCMYTQGEKPFIFARACNRGITLSGDHDVILCNDDALLETKHGFTALSRQAAEHPEYGIISAVTNIAGNPQQFRRNVGLREVKHCAFVCVYIPRETIRRVGLLDERYCLDYGVEDRDYCEAVRRAGMKIGVYDFCFVDHGKLHSTFRGDPKAPARFDKNLALFKQKWGYPEGAAI